jgi:hypothetical protein
MTEKVKLPQYVCDVLDELKSEGTTKSRTFADYYHNRLNERFPELPKHKIPTDTLMDALTLGYEPEASAEEQLKQLYSMNLAMLEKNYCQGIIDTLKILGIKYDWMDGAE